MKLKETKLEMFWEELHNAFKPLDAIPTWGVDLKINNHHMRGPKLKIFHIMQYLSLGVTLVTIKKYGKLIPISPFVLQILNNEIPKYNTKMLPSLQYPHIGLIKPNVNLTH